MIDRIKTRLAQEESGFTLIELLVVMIILAILMAIAVPSYLGFRDRANKSAVQSDLRALIPSVESYSSDNTGVAGDADNAAGTSGYQGITVALLHGYDQSIDAASTEYAFPAANLGTTTYCITATKNSWTAWKKNPDGQIQVKPAGDAAICA